MRPAMRRGEYHRKALEYRERAAAHHHQSADHFAAGRSLAAANHGEMARTCELYAAQFEDAANALRTPIGRSSARPIAAVASRSRRRATNAVQRDAARSRIAAFFGP
jgi:hypothetical protein